MPEETMRGKLERFLNEKSTISDLLKMVEEKTGVNRLYLFAGLVASLVLLLITGVADHFIVSLIGFLYPAYSSVKTIQAKDKLKGKLQSVVGNQEDDTKWLVYWVVYGAFVVFEVLGDVLLYWFPMYFIFKCGFLIWCMAPTSWNGSSVIYSRVIEPMMKSDGIDELVASASNRAGEFMKDAESKVKTAATEAIEKTLRDETKRD